MSLFYVPDLQVDSTSLNTEESHHAVKVLRHQRGDQIQITNGQGRFFWAEITEAHPKHCGIRISKTETVPPRDYYIHMALSPTKSIDRTEWFVEKAVELGVDEISFLLCEHSERKHLKLERLERIAISAMKQSLQAYLPKLHELVKFQDFIQQSLPQDFKFIAYVNEQNPALKQIASPKASYCLLIGPEGDFSPSEIDLALNNHFKAVSLGSNRYRTETAGIIACHWLNLIQAK